MALEVFQKRQIGLVLSGGGIRGMAHIGLIKAMQEFGVEAKAVSGSSIGAMIGAFYANGTTVEEMLNFFKETPLFQYGFFAFGKPGLINTDRYAPILKKRFEADDFSILKKPL